MVRHPPRAVVRRQSRGAVSNQDPLKVLSNGEDDETEARNHQWAQNNVSISWFARTFNIIYPLKLNHPYTLPLFDTPVAHQDLRRIESQAFTLTQNNDTERPLPLDQRESEEDIEESAPKRSSTPQLEENSKEEIRGLHNINLHVHRNQTKSVVELLKPIIGLDDGNSAFIFLCSRKEEPYCEVLPVRLSRPDDDVAVWEEISSSWNLCKGRWMNMLPFFGVKQVDFAEFHIIGYEPDSKILGTFVRNDSTAKEACLEQIVESIAPRMDCGCGDVTGYLGPLWPDNIFHHDDEGCSQFRRAKAQRTLLQLQSRRLWKLAFYNPSLAKGNDLLANDLLTTKWYDRSLIYSESDILHQIDIAWHSPKLRELRFHGVYIEEGFDFAAIKSFASVRLLIPLTLILLFALVLAAKLAFGDWGTAWNVGSFFVALAALIMSWTRVYAGSSIRK